MLKIFFIIFCSVFLNAAPFQLSDLAYGPKPELFSENNHFFKSPVKVNFKYDSSCEKEIFNKYYKNPSSVDIMNKFVSSIENDSSLTYLH